MPNAPAPTAVPRDAYVPAAEAAYIAGISVNQLNNLVDKGVLPKELVIRKGGQRLYARFAAPAAKVYYALKLPTTERKALLTKMVRLTVGAPKGWPWGLQHASATVRSSEHADVPKKGVLADWRIRLEGDVPMEADVSQVVADSATRAKEVDDAARLITRDPDVMNGLPCFAGTRVLVGDVLATLDEEGLSPAEMREHWPSITDEHIAAARLYEKLHPRRGRPPSLAELGWRGGREI